MSSFIKAYASRLKRAASHPIQVLVVDDEEAVRTFVERVLREAGYVPTLAGDGPQALEVASKMGSLDLLLTDVMMPQMSGDELKVLYLTGFSDRLFKEKVTLWEDEAFLEKPCSVKGLLQAVSLLMFGQVDVPLQRTS